jgi:hypothetical protein
MISIIEKKERTSKESRSMIIRFQIQNYINKLGIRILGYAALCYSLDIAVGLLILSEGIGIIEELV